MILLRSCCPGFESDGQGHCQAICEKSCGIHGKCVEPNVCRCNPGFSGDKCDKAGCPGELFPFPHSALKSANKCKKIVKLLFTKKIC